MGELKLNWNRLPEISKANLMQGLESHIMAHKVQGRDQSLNYGYLRLIAMRGLQFMNPTYNELSTPLKAGLLEHVMAMMSNCSASKMAFTFNR